MYARVGISDHVIVYLEISKALIDMIKANIIGCHGNDYSFNPYSTCSTKTVALAVNTGIQFEASGWLYLHSFSKTGHLKGQAWQIDGTFTNKAFRLGYKNLQKLINSR